MSRARNLADLLNSDGDVKEAPTPEVTTHKTGEITLDWTEATFV